MRKFIQLYKIKYLVVTKGKSGVLFLDAKRKDISFVPGQHMVIGFPGEMENREYSIYSGLEDSYLDFLIKEVDGGLVSSRLISLRKGDKLSIQGPYGFFVIPEDTINKKHNFIATGTGVAPFHSMVKSYSNLDYRLIHGIRNASEKYDQASYLKGRRVYCLSQDHTNTDYHGRLTDYLKQQGISNEYYYLCGNSAMIDEVYEILLAADVPIPQIRMEVYF